MTWSNTAERQTVTVEKSHSLSFSVRVEDRLHENIIQPADKCWFTVRPEEYKVGFNDTDMTNGTASVAGTGLKIDGVIKGTGENTVFSFEVQAAMLNLDADDDWYYDVTYVRNGYSMTVAAGEFDIVANVTNRGAQETYTGTGDVWEIISTVDGRNLLTVSSTIPLPMKGDPGNGSYMTTAAISDVVGQTTVVPVSSLQLVAGRSPQVGDVVFSAVTRGVVGTIQSISWTGTPSVTILTRQNYAMQTLKALLDIKRKDLAPGVVPNPETIDHLWAIPKVDVPLPPGYSYQLGDMVFSHTAISGLQAQLKLVISLVETQDASNINVRTKVVFPMFLDAGDVEDLLATKADAGTTVNGKPLTSNVTLTEDDIPAGTTNAKVTSAQVTKLNGLPTPTQYTADLAGKSPSGHTHNMDAVNGLTAEFDKKVESTTTDFLWVGTQANYDAISTKDPRTVYMIKG